MADVDFDRMTKVRSTERPQDPTCDVASIASPARPKGIIASSDFHRMLRVPATEIPQAPPISPTYAAPQTWSSEYEPDDMEPLSPEYHDDIPFLAQSSYDSADSDHPDRLDVGSIKYSQASISRRIRKGPFADCFLEDVVHDLHEGKLSMKNIPKLEVAHVDGDWYALNNHMLYILKRADNVREVPVSVEEVPLWFSDVHTLGAHIISVR